MPLRLILGRKISKLTAVATAAVLAMAPLPAFAQQGQGPKVLRDTESEQLLRDYTRPVLRAAGLEKQNIQVVIINDRAFNAFVADGHRIFVNYGSLMQSETPNQIIGVLAHETGHLAGGHLAKMHEQLARAQTQMIIAMLLGAGAIAAGARSGSGDNGLANAGAAAISAPQEIIRRSLLSYQRQQEENADRAAVKFLNATGQSAKGMYETFRRFTNDSLFAAYGADPYVQSHPMPAERVAALEQVARTSPYWDKKDDPAL
ncbi:MAG TPA: M48 family metalloprotease, partial [Bradyrhizobium sp.]